MKLQEEQAGWSETMMADEECQQRMPPQRPFSDVYSRGSPVAKRQKTEMEGTAQKLDEGEAAQEVLRSVADAAGTRVLGNTGVTTSTSLAQHVSQADGLADVSGALSLLYNNFAFCFGRKRIDSSVHRNCFLIHQVVLEGDVLEQ
jgi:hypothetical protein